MISQFPNLTGLNDPVLGQNLSFPVDPFIQIVHVQKNHWITVATISPTVVYVYDSVYNSVKINPKYR